MDTYVRQRAGKIIGAVMAAVLAVMAFRIFFDIAYVSGESMEPVFCEGDILLPNKWGIPEKGDIVTAYIEEKDCVVVKRILAAKGDRITWKDGGIYLNGERMAGDINREAEGTGIKEGQEIILSPGQYFLIGENQEVSLDSRAFGCIGESAVCGTVVCKLF